MLETFCSAVWKTVVREEKSRPPGMLSKFLQRSGEPLRSGVQRCSKPFSSLRYAHILRIDESVAYKDSKVVNRLPNALPIGSKI